MVMTKEERIELLKLAREAKKKKAEERKAMLPPVVKGRPKKVKEPEPEPYMPDDDIEDLLEEPVKPVRVKKEPKKTLELDLPEDEPEIIYEEIVKKKPKKKIHRKIIYEDDSDDDIEEEIIDRRTKTRQVAKPKVMKPPPAPEPKETPEMPKSYLGFFNY